MKKLILSLMAVMLFLSANTELLHAQSAALSKDYWVTYLPSKRPTAPLWLMMCTNVPNTRVSVEYADKPNYVEEFTINPNFPKEYKIFNDNGFLAKPIEAERIERRSVHVTASNPISLQGFTDADNNVGLFLCMPTSSLGQDYVIAAHNDQEEVAESSGWWSPNAFDSSAGGFVITAVEDGTIANIRVNGPTSLNRKVGSSWSVNLNRGETYWVQGAAVSEYDDLTGSTVTSNKPIGVIAGCEIMRAYDKMILKGHFDYNDYVCDQMLPVESWGTEYVSGPFTNKRGTSLDSVGDLYRVFAKDNTTITFNGRVQNPGKYWEFSLVTDPVHITSDKPIMVVQYDYYYDFHEANRPRTSNSEMVLVPRHNWRKNATFKVPTGYALTYFAVVAHKDSVDNIKVSIAGGPEMPVSALQYSGAKKYIVGDYAVRTIQLNRDQQVLVTGKCDFAVYNYGTRDNDAIKATYGYASAAAASFGSLSNAKPPKMVKDSACAAFNVTVFDSSEDGRGIGEMFLLNDPQGLYTGKPYVSTNVALEVSPFSLGSKSVTASIRVINPLKDAFAALYVTNRAGKDTVFTYSYSGAQLSITPTAAEMMEVLVKHDSCAVFSIKNNGKKAFTIGNFDMESKLKSKPQFFTATAVQTLPITLGPNESMQVKVCYNPRDTGIVRLDTLLLVTDCFIAEIAPLQGSGAVPTIDALDLDFGQVDVGNTICKPVRISNLSTEKELVLTKDILHSSNVFTLDPADLARMPITLSVAGTAGDHTFINVCYTPTKVGTDSTVTTWGKDIPTPFDVNNKKDWSMLKGRAVAAGVNTTLAAAEAQTTCTLDTIFEFQLRNTGSADATIDHVKMIGPDAPEFKLLKIGNITPFLNFPLGKQTSEDVQVQFIADLSGANPYRARAASLLFITATGDTSRVEFKAIVSHPEIASDKASLNFGELDLGATGSQTLTIRNDGTADLVIEDITLPAGFTIVSGLTKGQVIPPGGFTNVFVQVTSTVEGELKGELMISCNLCAGNLGIPMATLFARHEVLATGADYGSMWTCENNIRMATFKNRSTKDVLLKTAEITGSMYFSFEDPKLPGSGLLGNTIVTFSGNGFIVRKDSVVNLPILFSPSDPTTYVGSVEFTYDSGDGISNLLVRDLTGIGKNYPVELTLQSEANVYHRLIDKELIVPIEMKQDLAPADAYGFSFDVKYREDLFSKNFKVLKGEVDYTPTETSTVLNESGTLYRVITISGSGASPIAAGQRKLASLQLWSTLANKDTTVIQPSNLKFLRKDGTEICYMPSKLEPVMYYQELLCGDPTIKNRLSSNASVIQIIGLDKNPVRAQATLDFKTGLNDLPISVTIFDALGHAVKQPLAGMVMSKGRHSVDIITDDLASGDYIIVVQTSGDTHAAVTTKLIVKK